MSLDITLNRIDRVYHPGVNFHCNVYMCNSCFVFNVLFRGYYILQDVVSGAVIVQSEGNMRHGGRYRYEIYIYIYYKH